MEKLKRKNIKGYQLIENIEGGGQGEIYKAHQETIGREVAIKFIKPEYANHPDFVRRFETEAHVIARLEHPYIVPLYDYWRDPEGAYLVMRWLRGGSLRDRLQRDGAIPVDEVSAILNHICSGLELAHRHDVIHRDIKPGNILLDEDGNAYLTDFGIAKDLNSYDANHTGVDEIVGTLRYISPEQARSEAISPATDIYSLGVMLYELLAGEHPFAGASVIDLLYKHINDPIPELTTLDLTIRDAVNDVIQKSTKKDPAERYQDAPSFAGAFRDAINADHVANSLTQREYDVLQCIARGMTSKEIAEELFIAASTVRTYTKQLYKKLGVRSRVQATLRARELNLLDASVGQKIPELGNTTLLEAENPYKGLHAFQPHDSRDFFGREQLIDKLLKKMQDGHENERFLAVIGPGGSGKSSLVKAGLIPAIWNGKIPGSDRWMVIEMIPGKQPLEELEVALTRISTNSAADLHEQLRRNARGLLRASNVVLPEDDRELVIVIDQFEELFTYVNNEEERLHFLNILYEAVRDPRSRVRVIITLRADFYDRPLHYPEFGALLRSRMETILPLTPKELQHAIVMPAKQQGVTFQDGLVAHIVSDVNYQAGALPLLQYALTELFERRQGHLCSFESYQSIGGVIGALTQHAETLFAELDAKERQITKQMFLRLVTPGEGTGDARRRVSRSELLSISENSGVMDDLIDLFASHRMLTMDNDPLSRTPTVEVAHEAILGQWKRLRTWINLNREELKMQQQVSRMADEWNNVNRDPGYLARGLRLDQMLDWAEHSDLSLSNKEQEFLNASLRDRQQRKELEEARKEREITLERQSVQRLRGLVAIFVIATVVSVIFGGVVFKQRQDTEHANETISAINIDLQRQFNESRSLLLVNEAQDAIRRGDDFLASALAVEAARVYPESEQALSVLGEQNAWMMPLRQLSIHSDVVSAIAFSPDGQTAVSGSRDNSLILWDIASGETIRQFDGHSGRINAVAFNSENTAIISASADNSLILWDIATGNIIRQFTGHEDRVLAMAISPDNQLLLSATCANKNRNGICTGSQIILWDVTTGEILDVAGAHEHFIHSLDFSADGQEAISASINEVFLWQVSNQGIEMLSQPVDTVLQIRHSAMSPHDNVVYAVLSDGSLVRQSVDGTLETVFAGDYRASSVAFSPDFEEVAYIAEDRLLIIDIEEAEIVNSYGGFSEDVETLTYSANGKYMLTGSADGTLMLWDLEPNILQRLEPDSYTQWVFAISPDGNTVAVATGRSTLGITDPDEFPIIVMDAGSGQTMYHLVAHTGVANSIAFSPDGQLIVSTGGGENIVWDAGNGNLINRYNHLPNADMAFLPDGETAISSSGEGFAVLWDVGTGEILRSYVETDPVPAMLMLDGSIAISPDGSTLALAHSQALILFDIETGEEIARYDVLLRSLSLDFSSDGHYVAASSIMAGIMVIDIRTGEVVHHIEEYDSGDGNQSSYTSSAAFSSDGQNLLTFWDSGAVVMWDLETEQPTLLGEQNDDTLGSVTFTPDGIPVSTGSPNVDRMSTEGVILWNLPDDILQWVEENRYTRDFTCDEREEYRIEPYCVEE